MANPTSRKEGEGNKHRRSQLSRGDAKVRRVRPWARPDQEGWPGQSNARLQDIKQAENEAKAHAKEHDPEELRKRRSPPD